jgi:hypothetical protein
MQTLKRRVAEVLEKYPETRNDDVDLTLTIWRLYYRGALRMADGSNAGRYAPQEGEQLFAPLEIIKDLPREDHVKRIRAAFQNDLKNPRWLPTREEVAVARRMNIENWRTSLGYQTHRDTL